jgi:hypothetical protein
VIRTYFIEVKRGEWRRYKLPPLGSRHVRMVRDWCEANTGWLKFIIIRKCPKCKSTDDWVDHFAAFPLKLPELCIKAGTSEEGVCEKCGAPWVRVVEIDDPKNRLGESWHDHQNDLVVGQRGCPPAKDAPVKKTLKWLPSCDCDAGEPVPAVVIDPFCGSGQTGIAAINLGRAFVGIDLKREYCNVAEARMKEATRQGRLL